MLISKLTDTEAGQGEGGAATEDHSHEYQTANQLFELMAANQNFSDDVNTLTPQDLVLLYKNLDLGTKLMTNANDMVTRRSNQYVETIVYHEQDSEESELSDVYSNEDLNHLFMVNNERIDLLTSGHTSTANTLSTQLGDQARRPCLTEQNPNLLFKDLNLQTQLETIHSTINTMDIEKGTYPTSLLDYICCKRLEVNDSLYMENIIRHVQHTIEHLKRISNGDFLTEKTKEKWREVKSINKKAKGSTKALATCTSIPLHIKQNMSDIVPTWEDVVHSAIDIRSLSKMLKKKIVVEVPNLVSGSFKFFMKPSAAQSLMSDNSDSLIISCKKSKISVEKLNKESRLNVILQLQRSETGQAMSKINSIMILENKPLINPTDPVVEEIPQMLSLEYKVDDTGDCILQEKTIKDEEDSESINGKDEYNFDDSEADFVDYVEDIEEFSRAEDIGNNVSCGNDSLNDDDGQYFNCEDHQFETNMDSGSDNHTCDEYEESDSCQTNLNSKMSGHNEGSFCVSPIDLSMTIQRLNKKGTALTEENEDHSLETVVKRKSPTRARIKSPYENKSLQIEEKKRKKLLEIRERREKRKIALAAKAKSGSGAPVPQPSNSVTKLSITNKSFYNSIYGRNGNVIMENKQANREHKPPKREVIDVALEGTEESSYTTASENNVKKFIDRSYYLYEAETEVTIVGKDKENTDLCSGSNCGMRDFSNNLNLITHLLEPPDNKFTNEQVIVNKLSNSDISIEEAACCNRINVTPINSPTRKIASDNPETTLVECRKSIDKIYDLLNKLGKSQENNNKLPKSKFTVNSPEKIEATTTTSSITLPRGDSGTSLKKRLSVDPSSSSINKSNNDASIQSSQHKQETVAIPNPPKVIISSKDKKKERKSPLVKVPENPLRAISQLLREFDNVHKNRQKHNADLQKPIKKADKSTDDKQMSKPSALKRALRFEQQHDTPDRTKSPRDRKTRNIPDVTKAIVQQSPIDDKSMKRKLTDFIDEAKEARGEAVRGPSKLNSRLNSLAQPKKSYVQAHSEEYQTKYGRNLMASRLQRLASSQPLSDRPVMSANSRNKSKKNGSEAVPTSVKMPSPQAPPIERATKARSAANNSEVKELQTGSSHKLNVPDPLDTLISKISARESYVKHQSGRAAASAALKVVSSERSRLPVVPDDIEIGSSSSSPVPVTEKATDLSTHLHYILDNMLKTKSNQHTLEVLPECTDNRLLCNEIIENVSSVQNFSKGDQRFTNYEENLGNQFDGNVFTLLESPYENEKKIRHGENKGNKVEASAFIHEKQPFKSLTDMEKFKEVDRRLSMGTFHKKLRIKGRVSPKQSMTHVFVLQSGDTASLVLKSTMSQRNVKKTFNNISELSTIPAMSKPHVDWNHTQIPMQVTVNYAMMPDYKSNQQSTSLVKLFDCSLRNESQINTPNTKRDSNFLSMKGAAYKEMENYQSDLFTQKRGRTGESSDYSNLNLTETNSSGLLNDGNGFSMLNSQKQNNSSNESGISAKDKDVTSSLDVLMGLLNEIQNITTGCTNIAEDNNSINLKQDSNHTDLISISSLDRLRQLGSDSSLYSFYLSECGKNDGRNLDVGMVSRLIETTSKDLKGYDTLTTDKEVFANLSHKKYVDRYTNVPSQIFRHGISCKTSAVQAGCSECIEFPGEKKNHNQLIDWIHIPTTNVLHLPQLDVNGDVVDKIEDSIVHNTKHIMKTGVTETCEDRKEICTNSQGSNNLIAANNIKIKKEKKTKVKYNVENKIFDSAMKMKRDILVTVYSILVFTVFAALSFPEVLYLT